MNNITIIHNPRCTKSRQTLEILESRSLNIKTVDYLHGELTQDLLNEIVAKLGLEPKEILRNKEEEFKALNLDLDQKEEVMKAILKYPKILERPIVIYGDKAVIGRPPENVLTLF